MLTKCLKKLELLAEQLIKDFRLIQILCGKCQQKSHLIYIIAIKFQIIGDFHQNENSIMDNVSIPSNIK